MKKIGFIGAYDKTDMITYIARILTVCGKRVIVADTTITQKTRYTIPAINPASSYITDFEDIDFAIGCTNIEQIKEILQIQTELPYDIMLIDIDNPYNIRNFELNEAERIFFVTGTDPFTLKRGLQIISLVQSPAKLDKIIFSQYMTKEENDYIEYLSSNYIKKWENDNTYFPIENGDLSVIAENQREGRINLRKLSQDYKKGLISVTKGVSRDLKEAEIKRAIRSLEEIKK